MQEFIQARLLADGATFHPEHIMLPPGVTLPVWVYEQTRQVLIDLNKLLVCAMTQCNSKTCPTMRANEWEFLCAAHVPPKEVIRQISSNQLS